MVPTLFRWFKFGNPFPVGRWRWQKGAGRRETISLFDDDHFINLISALSQNLPVPFLFRRVLHNIPRELDGRVLSVDLVAVPL